MKKLISAFLVVFAAMSAMLAAQSALADTKGMSISFKETATLKPGQSASLLSTKIAVPADGTVIYSLTDTVQKTVIYTETKTGLEAGQEVWWTVPYYDSEMTAKKPIKQIRASFVLDGKTYTYNLFYNFVNGKDGPAVTVEKGTWYSDNTACSFGPYFREERPRLTDKWYTFTPVDLSKQGRQTFEYIASNMYLIGEVYVDVNGDRVSVSYENFYADKGGNTKTLSEYFTFFHDLDAVTDVNPETMQDPGFRFGQSISIEKDLAGDTDVLLFVRNRVTYRDYVNGSHKLTRFWPNLPERVALRDQMRARFENDLAK